MLQLLQCGVKLADSAQIESMCDQFALQQSLKLCQFIDASLLKTILPSLEQARFGDKAHLGFNHEPFAKDLTIDGTEPAVHSLHLILNNQQLFDLIRQVTGCAAIGSFVGRIYRNLPDTDHHLSWHDDTSSNDRLIGISINLSTEAFSGGIFQLRDKRSKKILNEVANTGIGDAIIFRVSKTLEHRVTPINGVAARTSCAGWFSSRSNYLNAIKCTAVRGPADA